MFEILLNRSILSLKGSDTLQFLQRITTNDVIQNVNSYNYLLSSQGKYLYDFFVYKLSNNEILIDVETSCKYGLIQKLNFYKLRRDVVIEDMSTEYKVIYAEPEVKKDNMKILCTYKDPRFYKLGFRSVVTMVSPNISQPFRILDGNPLKLSLLQESENISITPLYIQHKYHFAIPDGVDDLISDRSMPSHFGAAELFGISFTKGCYVGQEVISRAKYQGVIRQKIFKIISGTEIAFEKGDEITDTNGEKIGFFCSGHKNLGIALLNEEKYLGLEKKIAIINRKLRVQIEIPEWRILG